MSQKTAKGSFILNLHPLHRATISIVLALLTYFILDTADLEALLRVTTSWLVFSVAYLVLSWIVLFKREVPEIRKQALAEDGSRLFVFLMVLVSSFSSIVMVLLLVISKHHTNPWLSIPVGIGGALSSWAMVHTVFTFHYAHEYYDDDEEGSTSETSGGLNFPGDDQPNYIDFAYFSFVIGCTFQVSDVEVCSKKIRRITLMHGLLSFALNTFVIALAINFIGSLMN